jgi:hypothetical protein
MAALSSEAKPEQTTRLTPGEHGYNTAGQSKNNHVKPECLRKIKRDVVDVVRPQAGTGYYVTVALFKLTSLIKTFRVQTACFEDQPNLGVVTRLLHVSCYDILDLKC